MQMRRHSKKRDAVLDMIRSTTCHPSAEWVYQQLRAQYPDISLGTVYRNISLFKEEGLVSTIATVQGQERYDGNTADHVHLICSHCGAVLDVEGMEAEEGLMHQAALCTGAKVTACSLSFMGVCPECMAREHFPLEAGAS